MKIYLVENCYSLTFPVEHFKEAYLKLQDACNSIKRLKTVYKNNGWTITGSGNIWFEATKQGIIDQILISIVEVN